MSVVIHWFRRDLRLTDNPALHAAANAANQVVPAYIVSGWREHHNWTGGKRQFFLCGCLESLAANLESIGSRLIVRSGGADEAIEKLIRETGAEAIYANRDYDPYGREMESKVEAVCARLNIKFHTFKERVLHEAHEVRTGSGDPYRVYTPYWKNWHTLPKHKPVPRVTKLGPPAQVKSEPLPTPEHWRLGPLAATLPTAGERAARQRMKQFLEDGRLTKYADDRNTPAGLRSSQLSPDLRFGVISIRELYQRSCQAREDAPPTAKSSIETYIKELAWREFYLAILHEYPEVLDLEFNPEFRGLEWAAREDQVLAWTEGRTGFPIVDAAMRQMLETGFMHNRTRMITAMFLTKDLHCDWRIGESFFMRHLIDGEIASNNGGWQWSAGTGADAAPYFRIQNPWTQTRRYDPEGEYIKTWIPELKNVPADRFHAPPKTGLPLAPGYPLPIVDHDVERDRALARYNKHRGR